MDDDQKALLSKLHALENAERERANLMRKQHGLIGAMLNAQTEERFDELVWQRARVGEEFAKADQVVREQTVELLAAVEQLRGTWVRGHRGTVG